jgi:hypothetical protein
MISLICGDRCILESVFYYTSVESDNLEEGKVKVTSCVKGKERKIPAIAGEGDRYPVSCRILHENYLMR